MPFRNALRGLALLSIASIGVAALSIEYCSSQNTGADDNTGAYLYQSWGNCEGNCSGYAFAILQYKECYCSDYIPSIQDSLSDCDEPCPGYPDNSCGNLASGLYGYLALGPAPAGTYAASTSASATPSPSSSSSSWQQTTSSTDSTYVVPVHTTSSTTSTSKATTSKMTTSKTSHVSITTSTTTTTDPTTSVATQSTPSRKSTTVRTSSHASPTSDVAYSSSAAALSSSSSSGYTSLRVTTIDGAPTTVTVTTLPSATPVSSSPAVSSDEHHSLSAGATAGIVIGALIGAAALIIAGVLFWRRKQRADNEDAEPGTKKPRRTTSVLSRTGLLSRGRQSMVENNPDESVYTGTATGANSVRHSTLFGAAGAGTGPSAYYATAAEPSSPLDGDNDDDASIGGGGYDVGAAAGGSERRTSKPFVYDQRLNPSALFANFDNGSRISMQDNNDYSRPLGVAHPDVRPSFESRRSGWD